MPKIFEQNQKINIIEYGSSAQDIASLREISETVLGCIKKLIRS